MCGVPGCRHVHRAYGLCAKHYQRRLARERKGVFHASTCACAPCLATQRHRDGVAESLADALREAM
jgi:hypothetical protein